VWKERAEFSTANCAVKHVAPQAVTLRQAGMIEVVSRIVRHA
jgi:hypothetical protein